MSLYGALFSGVSGLSAESSAMSAISDNITNVNTIGYKQTDVHFQTLVTKQVSLSTYSAGGVQSKPRSGLDIQGLLQSTSSSTDIAISGQGFFVVNSSSNPLGNQSGQFAYTRAGSFKVDKEGYLQNVSGWYLMGWPLTTADDNLSAVRQTINNTEYMAAYKDSTGQYHYIDESSQPNPTDLQALNLNGIAGTADATKNIRMGANLPAKSAVGHQEHTSAMMYDSLGFSHNILMTWTASGQNAWSLQSTPPEGAQSVTTLDAYGNTYSTAGRLDFSTLPSTGAFNMTVNGNTYKFVVGAGTNGTPANTLYIPSTPGESSSTYAADVAKLMDTVYQVEYNSVDLGNTFAAGDSLTANGVTATFGSTSPDAIAAQINSTDGMGVKAFSNNGHVYVYSTNQGTQTLSGTINSAALPAAASTLSSTGYTYVSAVPGYGSVVFNNYDTTQTVSIDGIASLMAGNPPGLATYAQTAAAIPTAADVGTLSVTGPLGTAAGITVPVGSDNIGNWIAAINAQTATTGVGAYWNGTTNQVDYYTTVPGAASIIGTGNAGASATSLSATFTNNGVKAVEQAYAPISHGPNNITLDSVSSTVYYTSTTGQKVGTNNIGPNTSAILFNGDGTPAGINVASYKIEWANGAEDQVGSSTTTQPAISLFLGDTNSSNGMTQLGDKYGLSYMSQDGAKFGNFAGVSIGSDGVVTALFDNGVQRPIFQIPVATFVNPNGMQSLTGNVYISTDFSGDPTLRTAGDAGAGQTTASSLESSTVDIGTQFTTMIVTQRAYSAASKVITTANQMLDDLMQVVR